MEQIWAAAKAREQAGEAAQDDPVPRGTVPTLVLHDSDSSAIYALVVSRKGAVHDAITKAVEVLDGLGYKELVLKNDQEPAIVSLNEAVRARWNGEATPEEAKVVETDESEEDGAKEENVVEAQDETAWNEAAWQGHAWQGQAWGEIWGEAAWSEAWPSQTGARIWVKPRMRS